MLSPKPRFVLLPQDRQIMQLTGMTEAQYRWFCNETARRCQLRPGEPVALSPLAIAGIQLAIGILLTVGAALLTPKPKTQEAAKQQQDELIDGQDIVRSDKFAPKSGFDSLQNVVELGSTVPLVYTYRDNDLGGVRVSTNLVWSQILSMGGGQFFRGMFLLGEGPLTIDVFQTALGNNLLGTYNLTDQSGVADPGAAERGTIYYAPEGGRIDEDDYLIGAKPATDPGVKNNRTDDIYLVEGGTTGALGGNFCQCVQPSNQNEFGVFAFIGNRMGFKIGEDFEACSQWQNGNKTDGDDKIPVFERQQSNTRYVDQVKASTTFPTRAGIISVNGITGSGGANTSLSKGDQVTYKIFSTTDADAEFQNPGSLQNQPDADIDCKDAGSTVASIQRGYDEAINIGDTYMVGTALAICTDRDNFPFFSDNDFGGPGQSVEATFEILEPGIVSLWSESGEINPPPLGVVTSTQDKGVNATEKGHIYKVAIASVSIERPAYVIELGFKSSLGIRSNGIVNFDSLKRPANKPGDNGIATGSYRAAIDALFCAGLADGSETTESYRQVIRPGRYTAPDVRYSFFKISYRNADSATFTELNDIYGFRSQTQSAVYNFLRFEFPDQIRREIRLVPMPGWEVRNFSGNIWVLDSHVKTLRTNVDAGVRLEFNGERITKPEREFSIKAFRNREGIRAGYAEVDDGRYYVDAYARLAESFIYGEVTSSANAPENSISYVNIVQDNATAPEYDDLAVLGFNINASAELTSLDQLSVYVTQGLRSDDGTAIWYRFPEVFKDLLTNKRYGAGAVFDPKQIDNASFAAATTWTNDRGYFFDGAITEKINLRSWGAERARDFLLELGVSGGRYILSPIVNIGQPETVVASFSFNNIIEDSFEMSFADARDRAPIKAVMRWREERQATGGVNGERGMFPQVREFGVRWADSTPDDDLLVEQIDLSNFCTNRRHAIDRAKLEILERKYQTHSVTFKTTPPEALIEAGSIIQLSIESVDYWQARNGAIGPDGTITCEHDLDDGTHEVLHWDGSEMVERDMVVVDGKTDLAAGAFCLRALTFTSDHYKVTSVSFDADGNVDVTAIVFPLLGSQSIISANFDDANFIIED